MLQTELTELISKIKSLKSRIKSLKKENDILKIKIQPLENTELYDVDLVEWLNNQKNNIEFHENDLNIDIKTLNRTALPKKIYYGLIRKYGTEFAELTDNLECLHRILYNWGYHQYYYRIVINVFRRCKVNP